MFPKDHDEIPYEKRPETDFLIHPISSQYDADILAYALYTKLSAYEDHYNNIQNKYKSIAATWIFATFAGMGYLIAGHETALNLFVLLPIAFLCFISAQGIFFLWFLDSRLCHELIDSIHKEIIKLEEQYPIIGKTHHLELEVYREEKDPHLFHGFYYSNLIFFLLAISTLSLAYYLYSITIVGTIFVVALFLISFIIFLIYHKKVFIFSKRKIKSNNSKNSTHQNSQKYRH